MSTAALHRPYLKVLLTSHGSTARDSLHDAAEVAASGVGEVDAAADLTVEDAYLQMADGVATGDRADVVAAAHSFVLGLALSGPDDPGNGHDALGKALVAPHVSDPPATAEVLRAILVDVIASSQISDAHLSELETAFGGALTLSGDASQGSFTMSGDAGWLVAMLLDFTIAFGQEPRCTTTSTTEHVNGQDVAVTVVTLETCTNLPLSMATRGIDPRHWPDLNPFFKQIEVLRPKPPPGPGTWAGVIQEVVGPAVNASLYTTNLDVTYLEDVDFATTTFDLAPDDPQLAPDDGRVDVDRGVVAVTDEGEHRRIQVTKIFHIDDLDVPNTWVCPLWAWQIVIAGWIGT